MLGGRPRTASGSVWSRVRRVRVVWPCGVAATMTEAHLVAHKRLTGAEVVPVTATRPRVGDPLPGRRRHQLAQHNYRPKASAPPALAGEDGSATRSPGFAGRARDDFVALRVEHRTSTTGRDDAGVAAC